MSLSAFGFSRHHLIMLSVVGFMVLIAFFDFLILWHFSDLLSAVFSLERLDTSWHWLSVAAIFIAGHLVRPMGGFLLGSYADKKGRKPALCLALFGTSLFTLMIGLLPTYEQIGLWATILLVLARVGQGMSFSAIIPLAWIYVAENLPSRQIGLGVGVVCMGIALALLMTAWLTCIFNEHLTHVQLLGYAWRLPFVVSGVLGMLALLMYRHLQELSIFEQSPQSTHQTTPTETKLSKVMNIKISERLQGSKRLQGIVSMFVLSWFVGSITIFNVFLLPLLGLGTTNEVSAYFSLEALFGSLFFVGGCVFFGFLADRIHAATVIGTGSIALVLSAWGLFHNLLHGGQLTLLFFVLTGFTSGVIASTPALMVRLSPLANRATILCVVYNIVNAIIGSVMPLLLSFATFHMTLAPVIYLAVVCVMTVLFLVFFISNEPQQAA
ncbi:MAG: MFS transporter [Moraxella sp.]|nr:MFS transporter [Moraxella sp.]